MIIRNKIIKEAKSHVGTKEVPAFSNNTSFSRWWYGRSHNLGPWCAMFVQKCIVDAGYPELVLKSLPNQGQAGPKGSAYCPFIEAKAKKTGKWISKNSNPKLADAVLFDWPGVSPGVSDHIGFVYKVNYDGTIMCIEGNTGLNNDSNGGEVMIRKRYRSTIKGFVNVVPQEKEITITQNSPDKFPAKLNIKVPKWPGKYFSLKHVTSHPSLIQWEKQMALRGWTIYADGKLDRYEEKVIVMFQARMGLKVDGIIGPKTWEAAFNRESYDINTFELS